MSRTGIYMSSVQYSPDPALGLLYSLMVTTPWTLSSVSRWAAVMATQPPLP